MRMDLLEKLAIKNTPGLADGWKPYRWACMPKEHATTLYYEIEGAVVPPIRSGPRKGQPNYKAKDKATVRTIIVPVAQAEQWMNEWQAETGNCLDCLGDKQTLASMNFVTKEVVYRSCRKCNGTGKAETTHA